jgi:gliding motility-associated-like protein
MISEPIKTMTIKYIMSIAFILLSGSSSAQFLDNPSLEGPPGIGIIPPSWQALGAFSTPDTEPLDCDDFPASDGQTYMTLVARGSDSSMPMTVEKCQTQLLQSFQPGECYTLTLDLVSRDDLGHYVFGEGFKNYTAPSLLKIYGSASAGEQGELLLETSPITNTLWETFSFSIKPSINIAYLKLEIALEQNSSENGNILVDHLIIDNNEVSRVMMNDTIAISDLPFALVASEGSSYSWSPSSGLSCDDCRSPEVNRTVSATYTCSFFSTSTGCPEKELFMLTITDEIEPLSGGFKIPNVFTPNGDHFNDVFEITGLPPYSSLIVFDRSGKEVFRSEEYNNEWDGRDLEGNSLPEGTYWYVLITPGLSGKQKGYVYLQRE